MWKLVVRPDSSGRDVLMQRMQLGIFAVAVVGVAALLNGLLNGFGLGEGSGGAGGEGESETVASVAAPETTPASTPSPVPSDEGVTEILVDERAYFVSDGAEMTAVDLDDAVGAAVAVEGRDGVRVRVRRTKAARASAEEALLSALNEAGLDRSEIVVADGFVERE